MKQTKQNVDCRSDPGAYPRRTFLKKLASIGALSFMGGNLFPRFVPATMRVYPPRVRVPNPYVSSDGKPLLVVTTGNDFREMLQAGLEKMGGLGKLIHANQDVLIKPNLNAVDVYPAISSVEAISLLAQEVVSVTQGKVTVGDMGFHSDDRVYGHIDLEDRLKETGADAIYFSDTYPVRRAPVTKFIDCKAVSCPAKPDISVYSDVYDAPIIINFACLKRHFLAHMSTALKNNVGAVAGSGASQSRAYLHENGTPFLTEVAEIAGVINPELTIIDVRSALIGNGPFSDMSGAEILEGVNTLVMSGDMIAVDLYCSMLLQGLDRTFSSHKIRPTLEHAHRVGLGVKDLSEVEILEPSTSIENSVESVTPHRLELYQNYPNPFNASTQIGFKLEEKYPVSLSIYDSLGRKVSTLIEREMFPGEYTLTFDGGPLSSGTYFYQLKVGQHVLIKKMTLLK